MKDYPSALVLNAWQFPASIRHQVIFDVLKALPVHQALTLVNDHDPKPLFYQLDAENPGMFHHEPLEAPNDQYFVVLINRLPVGREIPTL